MRPEFNKANGLLITKSMPKSPAEKVLQRGDQYRSVNGRHAKQGKQKQVAVCRQDAATVKATVRSEGKKIAAEVVRGLIPNEYGKADKLVMIAQAKPAE